MLGGHSHPTIDPMKPLSKELRLLSLATLISILFLLAMSQSARADIAPPEHPPGSNISPEKTTKVRMSAENILFDVTKLGSSQKHYVDVDATFTMVNEGSSTEEMLVRFPLGCEDTDFPAFSNLTVAINDIPLTVTYESDKPIILPLPPLYRGPANKCETMPWAAFPVTFPPGQQTIVNVHYEILPTGISDSAGAFGYILETGAGWYGTIGNGTFVVRLPYDANADNISGLWESSASLVPKYSENEAVWQVENLEPTPKNNLVFRIIYPSVWQSVVDALKVLEKTPKDVDALIQLGKAYRNSAWEFHGNTNAHYLDLGIQAYNRALSINPYSAEAHLGIAQALWDEQGIILYPLNPKAAFLSPILHHLSLALSLEPENSEAGVLWHEIDQMSENHQIVLPTVNPKLLPSPTVTPTQTATYTSQPTSSSTATFTPGATTAPTKHLSATPELTVSLELSSTPAPPKNQSSSSGLWLIILMVVIIGSSGAVLVFTKRQKK